MPRQIILKITDSKRQFEKPATSGDVKFVAFQPKRVAVNEPEPTENRADVSSDDYSDDEPFGMLSFLFLDK